MNKFKVARGESGGVPVLRLKGRLTIGEGSRDLRGTIADIAAEGHTYLLLDLGEVTYIDSSGLGAFISFLRKLNEKKGDLKLCGMSKQVRAVFELVRMHRILDIYGTREEAVRAFHA